MKTLIVTIIVMLVLAGVSLNAIVGDNGIIKNAQVASVASKVASYKEELETSIVGVTGKNYQEKDKITALNENVRKYIPSLKDEDIGKYGIVEGELYYLGNNDIERKTCLNQGLRLKADNQTEEEFYANVENSAINNIMQNEGTTEFTQKDNEGNYKLIGEALKDKVIGENWKLVKEVENNITKNTYATGWYYVTKNTVINGIGKLNNDYMIKYQTGEIVQFDDTKHTILSDELVLEGSEYLLCNVDARILEEYSTKILTGETFDPSSLLGDNVELIGYDDINGNVDYSQAFGEKEFIFDGKDDYLKIKFLRNDGTEEGNAWDEVQKNKLKNNGLTFEFYGTFDGGRQVKPNGSVNNNPGYLGIFNTVKDDDNSWPGIRFGFLGDKNNRKVLWDSCGKGHGLSSLSHSSSDPWNQMFQPSDLVQDQKLCYFTVSVDPHDKTMLEKNLTDDTLDELKNPIGTWYIKEKMFVNGAKFCDGWLEIDSFLNDDNADCVDYFIIGRGMLTGWNWWHYTKMDCKSIRLYATGLTDEQIMKNYRATVGLADELENY